MHCICYLGYILATRFTSRPHITDDIRAPAEGDESTEFAEPTDEHCCSPIP